MDPGTRFKLFITSALPLAMDCRSSTLIWETQDGVPLAFVAFPRELCPRCLEEMIADLVDELPVTQHGHLHTRHHLDGPQPNGHVGATP